MGAKALTSYRRTALIIPKGKQPLNPRRSPCASGYVSGPREKETTDEVDADEVAEKADDE